MEDNLERNLLWGVGLVCNIWEIVEFYSGFENGFGYLELLMSLCSVNVNL